MLTTPLFAVTRDNGTSKKVLYFLRLRSHILWLSVALGLSITLLVSDHNQVSLIKGMRTYLVDFLAPVMEQTSSGLGWIQSSIENFKAILSAHVHNKYLIKENFELKKWKELAHHLHAENQSLKHQLSIIEDEAYPMLTARVITYPSGVLTQTLLLNAGRRNGAKKDQPVVAKNAVVGRIVEVGETSSRVLLITDLHSRIPVMLESSRTQAILSGTNLEIPKLIHFKNDDLIKDGERVITSGKGGIFPYGLLLGKVVIRDRIHYVLSPLVWNQLEYVQILTHSISSQGVTNE
jgi:rod shape-determining protein MreC